MPFPLTITIYDETLKSARIDEDGSFTCLTHDGTIPAVVPSLPEITLLEMGSRQTLAQAFKQQTGKDLSEGCWPPVGVKEETRPFAQHTSVYV